jgi:hypothetical protein
MFGGKQMSEAVILQKRSKRLFWRIIGLFGIVLNALALVALIHNAVDVGNLMAPLNLVMTAYIATTQFMFGWAEPYLRTLVASVGRYFSRDLTLYFYWKDALVLFGVYGAGYARAQFVLGEFKCGPAFIIHQIRTAIAVLVAALAVGALPLRSHDGMVEIAVLSLSLGVYSSIFVTWHDFIQTLLLIFYIVCMAPLLAWLIGEPSLGLVEALFFVSLALRMLGSGIRGIFQRLATRKDRYALEQTGLVIAWSFAGAACFFAICVVLKGLAL